MPDPKSLSTLDPAMKLEIGMFQRIFTRYRSFCSQSLGRGDNSVGAMFAEACYRALTSGFYNAGIQGFRYARPVWAALIFPMALVLIVGDGMEYIVHFMCGTQRLRSTVTASLIFTIIFTFLELFAMHHGVLVNA